METRSNSSSVAQLAGARLPADRGLSSLGLLMQLVGSFFLGYMALIALLPIFAGGAPGSWQIFLLGATGAVRAAFHRNAGSALLYGAHGGPLRAVRMYAIVALIETALWAFIIHSLDPATRAGLSFLGEITLLPLPMVIAALAIWPVTLLVVATRQQYRDVAEDQVPHSEDMGFEGSAVLMVVLGVMGVLASGLVVYGLFKMKAWSGRGGAIGLLFLGVFIMLLARSGMHALAGLRGTSGVGPDRASESAASYYSFGVISSVIAGGALLIAMMMNAIHPVTLLMVGIVVFFLLMWPLILRRFYTERNFSVLLAGQEAPTIRRAPDAGMTALGWLLLMFGTYSLVMAIAHVVSDVPGGFGAARSPWWQVGLGLVQVWAAFELITMSDRWKLAGITYGVVATVVTLFLVWPELKELADNFRGFGRGPGGMVQVMMQGVVAIYLVIPIVTIALCVRNITPQATARFTAPQATE